MNEQVLNEALNDVKLIKQVISRTARPFLSLGKIFIGLGVVFLVKLMLLFVIMANESVFFRLFTQLPLLGYSIYPAFIAAGIIIFVYFSRKTDLIGLSKQLADIWAFIIGINFITPIIIMVMRFAFQMSPPELYRYLDAISLVTFAIGFFITYILTNLKLMKWACIIYIAAGITAFINPDLLKLGINDYLWTFTFMTMGFYFEYKNKMAGRN